VEKRTPLTAYTSRDALFVVLNTPLALLRMQTDVSGYKSVAAKVIGLCNCKNCLAINFVKPNMEIL
jgi:hypothetical protein